MKEFRVITKASDAKKLLELGQTIVSIKKHKFIDNATVFVFKNTEVIENFIHNK